MGTSSSYGGPGDKTPLLPAWALPGGDPPEDGADDDEAGTDSAGDEIAGPDSDESGDSSDSADPSAGDESSSEGHESADDGSDPNSSQQPPAARPPAYWQSAKRQLGQAVSGRTGRAGYEKAGRAYVRARGGSKQAAATGRSARAATASLGRFLSDVRNNGFGPAMERLGLATFVGRSAHTVFAAILDAIAPEGKTREEVATREAISETLASLFGEFVTDDPGGAFVDAMTAEAINSAIQASIVAAAFNRFTGDLARQLEEKAISSTEALRVERDIRQYMVDTVQLDFTGKDPLNMQWETVGGAMIDTLYEDAYRMIGGEQ